MTEGGVVNWLIDRGRRKRRMEKKDRYEVYLDDLPGKDPKTVRDHGVSDDMGQFWGISPVFPRDRSPKWGKIQRSRSRRYVPFLGYT